MKILLTSSQNVVLKKAIQKAKGKKLVFTTFRGFQKYIMEAVEYSPGRPEDMWDRTSVRVETDLNGEFKAIRIRDLYLVSPVLARTNLVRELLSLCESAVSVANSTIDRSGDAGRQKMLKEAAELEQWVIEQMLSELDNPAAI